MFDRFTDRARRALGRAREEAVARRHTWIGTEHLLLGLMRECPATREVLESLDVETAAILRAVEARVRNGSKPVGGNLPFTQTAERALAKACAAADWFGHRHFVDAEHLLLGVLDAGGVGAAVFEDLGVSLERACTQVKLLLGLPPVGASPKPKAVRHREDLFVRLVDALAGSPAHVLIHAWSPAKRLAVARQLHERGPRREKPFVALDCGPLFECQLDAELFGDGKKTGALERAAGGTLFLDLVDTLPEALQKKLARALTERTFQRVGDVEPIELGDVRIVSGTALHLRVVVEEGKFDARLWALLNQAKLEVPPAFEILPVVERVRVPDRPPVDPAPAVPMRPFVPPAPPLDRSKPLLERLTRRTERVLGFARGETKRLAHPAIESDHLLLGIVREGSGIAAIVLLELLGDLGRIEPVVKARTGAPRDVDLDFGPSARASLDLADEAAFDLGRDTIEPEHLLIGIARDGAGSGAILRELGLDLGDLEARVRRRLGA